MKHEWNQQPVAEFTDSLASKCLGDSIWGEDEEIAKARAKLPEPSRTTDVVRLVLRSHVKPLSIDWEKDDMPSAVLSIYNNRYKFTKHLICLDGTYFYAWICSEDGKVYV